MRGLSSVRLKLSFFFFILMFIKCLLRFILGPFKGSELNACSLFESFNVQHNNNNNNNNNNNGLISVHPWYGSSPDIK